MSAGEVALRIVTHNADIVQAGLAAILFGKTLAGC